MRRLIWMMSVSIDGYMEGPDHDISWHLVDEELHQYFNDELGAMGMFLEGRVTYELMADFWPTADQEPDAPPVMVEFARIWCDMPKLVFSRTLEQADWNATVLHEVDPQHIRELKAQDGGDLLLGGSNIAAEFVRHDLIDEYRVYVHPVLVGRGTRMLHPTDVRHALRTVEVRQFGNGVVGLRYERVRPEPAA